MIKVINKKNIYLLFLFIISLLAIVILPTYAKFSSSYETTDEVAGLNLNFNIGITNIEEYEMIEVLAGDFQIFNIEIKNSEDADIYYGIWHKKTEPTNDDSNITVAKLDGSTNNTSGVLTGYASTTVSIIVINNTTNDIKINIGVASSKTNTKDIEYLGGKYLITGTASKIANTPNLDNNNLIPVYYDEIEETWKKADKTNKDNNWYNYDNKKWANAVLISDEDIKNTYQKADAGTNILDKDITAFYVWIPRFKYRVWNITRKSGDESTYSYPAYSNGIEIEWESNTETTGNIKCSYDNTLIEGETNLFDKCYYNNLDIPISSDENNINYTNAWYTHPAFTFGTKEIEGFWIGKFETTGDSSKPTILPNITSLRNQTRSEQFITSKIFENYLSSNIDAHIITNLEWGAVAYLTHSTYGLCNENSNGINCEGVYLNNSNEYYTGRSGGATSTNISTLATIYSDTSDLSTTKNNKYGYYDYEGYFLNLDGSTSMTKDITKVASTTKNITGVYDMVGGAFDSVMGNMLNQEDSISLSKAGESWNETPWYNTEEKKLSIKYYNSYSYSTTTTSYNRAILGDATAEIIGNAHDNSISTNGWNPGNGITGTEVLLPSISDNYNYVWTNRGGNYDEGIKGIFSSNISTGEASNNYTFRSTLT